MHTTRIVALETTRVVGACLEPFMPTTSRKLRDALGLDDPVLKDQIETEQDQAEVLWDRWSGRKVNGIRLF
jgi:methionyl-tRNA synthetase